MGITTALQLSPTFTPYVEYDYLDKQGYIKGGIILLKTVTALAYSLISGVNI